MDLEGHDPQPFAARRRRLAAFLDGVPALLPAGAPQPRNLPADTYPYRATSHFLYFVGLPIQRAMVLVDGAEHSLFVPLPSSEQALWTGPQPSPEELSELTRMRVRPLESVGDAIGGRDVGTLAAMDLETQKRQAALLGRAIGPGELAPADAAVADAVISARLVHDERAQDGLRRAAAATVEAHRAGMAATRPGVREWVVRAAMEREFVARGMGTSYGPIVTVHGEVLHNDEHHHELSTGDLLLADVGAEARDGWAADVTRTWPVSGRFSGPQRELYELVLAAQRDAIAAVEPGARYRDVHLTACRTLARGLVELGVLRGDPEELVADGVHALLFPHGVGHLLGLDVHDMEDLGDRAGYAPDRSRSEQFGLAALRLDRDLEPGMAVTIEPGLYRVPAILDDPELAKIAGDRLDRGALERFADVRGIRIEDDVLVTEQGREVLTEDAPKAPGDVEAAVEG